METDDGVKLSISTITVCEVMLIFIRDKSCTHRYVSPNMQNIRAACRLSWGIVSGMNRGNCAAQTKSYWNLNFYNVKLENHHVNSVQSVQCIGKMHTWKHSDEDLACHCLATQKVFQVFLPFLVITWFFP